MTIRISGVIILTVLVLCVSCNLFSPGADGDAPEGHTVNKNGAFHKPGLDNPLANCVECHGADLRGGTSGVSCFRCHGQVW